MLSRFVSSFAHYFPRRLSVQLRDLYVAIGILNLATAAIMVFEPIYLLQRGYGIHGVLLFYLGIYLSYFFILPLGARFAVRFGYQRSMVTGSTCLVVYYLSLLGLASSPLFLLAAIPTLAVQKALYWPGYHADFARYGDDREEAREVSGREVLDVVVTVIGPFFGGLLLYLSNFETLFVVVCLLILLSNLPLLTHPEEFTPGTFAYSDAYRRLVLPENRRLVVSFLGYGEELIVLVLWPIYMYAFVEDFLSLGSLVAGTTLLTATVILYVGRLTDHTNKRNVLRVGSVLYAFVWVLRSFAGAVAALFWVDALSRLTKKILAVPQLALVYERARETHHIMRTAVLFEMSVVVGKIAALLVALVVFDAWPAASWPIVFTAAALFTLLYARL